MRLHALLLVVALTGCKSSSPSPATTTPKSEEPSAPAVAELPPAPPAEEPAPGAVARPASVTDEMVAVADRMMVAMEALGQDTTAAGEDCAKGAAALRKHAALIRPIALDAKKFENMDDKAADEWFEATYAPRMMAAMEGLMVLSNTCASNKEFQAASEEFGKSLD